jgi:hypothetical protein
MKSPWYELAKNVSAMNAKEGIAAIEIYNLNHKVFVKYPIGKHREGIYRYLQNFPNQGIEADIRLFERGQHKQTLNIAKPAHYKIIVDGNGKVTFEEMVRV